MMSIKHVSPIIVFILGMICYILYGLFSDLSNHHEAKVRVKPQSYQPCYIRLDEEQFERLIDALKKDEK